MTRAKAQTELQALEHLGSLLRCLARRLLPTHRPDHRLPAAVPARSVVLDKKESTANMAVGERERARWFVLAAQWPLPMAQPGTVRPRVVRLSNCHYVNSFSLCLQPVEPISSTVLIRGTYTCNWEY